MWYVWRKTENLKQIMEARMQGRRGKGRPMKITSRRLQGNVTIFSEAEYATHQLTFFNQAYKLIIIIIFNLTAVAEST